MAATPLSAAQAQQITAVFRYMRDRQIAEPKSAIAQMQMSEASATEEIAVCLRASVADELCRRYPDGSMSDRILRLLGALQNVRATAQPSSECDRRASPAHAQSVGIAHV